MAKNRMSSLKICQIAVVLNYDLFYRILETTSEYIYIIYKSFRTHTHIVGDNHSDKSENFGETEKQGIRDRRLKWLQYFLREKIQMFPRISYPSPLPVLPPSQAFRAIDSPTLIAHDPFTGDFSGAKGSS